MVSALRHYQTAGLVRIGELKAQKIRKIVVVSPTGSGKGTMAAVIMYRAAMHGRRCLFVVHRKEIIDDIYKRLIKEGLPESMIGVIRGNDKRRNPSALIQIASIDTLRNRVLPDAEIVIMDECHRAMGATQQAFIEQYQESLIIGFTGTPVRLDGRSLSDTFEEIVVLATPGELIRAGFILSAEIFSVPKHLRPDLTEVRSSGNDFNVGDLSKASDKPHLVGAIVDHWLRRAKGRMTLVSAVNVEHSKRIVDAFVAAGVAAEHINGSMGEEQRADILARYRTGAFPILSQCNLLVEGIDIPEIKCVILARMTKSLTIYLQMVGRAMRPCGDDKMLILDHAGNVLRHGRPDIDRDWVTVFREKKRRSAGGDAPSKECPKCFKILHASARVCKTGDPDHPTDEDGCGHVFVFHDPTKTIDGELVEIPPPTPEEERIGYWAQQCYIAGDRDFDLDWVRMRFRECFSEEAPANWIMVVRPPRTYSPEELEAGLQLYRALARRTGKDDGWVMWVFRKKFGTDPPAPHPSVAASRPEAPASAPTEVPDNVLEDTSHEHFRVPF